MNIRTTVLARLVPLCTVASFIAGCGAVQAVEEVIDCTSICNRYKDCFDGDYDASACVDRCQTKASADENYSAKVNECEACADDRSCAGSFMCAGECLGIVP